jgi:hypothetical protein
MNGVLKIPMQFFILLTGVLVFVFYQFNFSPLHWNEANLITARSLDQTSLTVELEQRHVAAVEQRKQLAERLLVDWRADDTAAASATLLELKALEAGDAALQQEFKAHLKQLAPKAEDNDKDYIFVTFIMDHLPVGIIGLLLAMIFCAGMSSTSAELSALATTSTVDVLRSKRSDDQQVRATKLATVVFGLLALCFAALFSLFENLIQAVNILGSLFYGTILGIFLVAFFIKHVHGSAVFIAALIAQATILVIHFSDIQIAFLWYNLIAPAILVLLAIVFQALQPKLVKTSG